MAERDKLERIAAFARAEQNESARDLRERRRQIEGDAFDLEAFHNEFLSFGSAPVATIAELMTD